MAKMTATCMAACQSSEYRTALQAEGYTPDQTLEYEGKTYTHDDLAVMVDEAYRKLRPQYVVQAGAKRHVQRKNERQFQSAVRKDVLRNSTWHLSWWTVTFGLIVLLLTGPFGLLIAIAVALFNVFFEKDADGDEKFCRAMESGT